MKLCAFRCLISRPQILNLTSQNQIRGKLLLSQKLHHFRGSRFSVVWKGLYFMSSLRLSNQSVQSHSNGSTLARARPWFESLRVGVLFTIFLIVNTHTAKNEILKIRCFSHFMNTILSSARMQLISWSADFIFFFSKQCHIKCDWPFPLFFPNVACLLNSASAKQCNAQVPQFKTPSFTNCERSAMLRSTGLITLCIPELVPGSNPDKGVFIILLQFLTSAQLCSVEVPQFETLFHQRRP